jgi:hypothetical protein
LLLILFLIFTGDRLLNVRRFSEGEARLPKMNTVFSALCEWRAAAYTGNRWREGKPMLLAR